MKTKKMMAKGATPKGKHVGPTTHVKKGPKSAAHPAGKKSSGKPKMTVGKGALKTRASRVTPAKTHGKKGGKTAATEQKNPFGAGEVIKNGFV